MALHRRALYLPFLLQFLLLLTPTPLLANHYDGQQSSNPADYRLLPAAATWPWASDIRKIQQYGSNFIVGGSFTAINTDTDATLNSAGDLQANLIAWTDDVKWYAFKKRFPTVKIDHDSRISSTAPQLANITTTTTQQPFAVVDLYNSYDNNNETIFAIVAYQRVDRLSDGRTIFYSASQSPTTYGLFKLHGDITKENWQIVDWFSADLPLIGFTSWQNQFLYNFGRLLGNPRRPTAVYRFEVANFSASADLSDLIPQFFALGPTAHLDIETAADDLDFDLAGGSAVASVNLNGNLVVATQNQQPRQKWLPLVGGPVYRWDTFQDSWVDMGSGIKGIITAFKLSEQERQTTGPYRNTLYAAEFLPNDAEEVAKFSMEPPYPNGVTNILFFNQTTQQWQATGWHTDGVVHTLGYSLLQTVLVGNFQRVWHDEKGEVGKDLSGVFCVANSNYKTNHHECE